MKAFLITILCYITQTQTTLVKPIKIIDNISTLGVYAQELGVINPKAPFISVIIPVNISSLTNNLILTRKHMNEYTKFISTGKPSILTQLITLGNPWNISELREILKHFGISWDNEKKVFTRINEAEKMQIHSGQELTSLANWSWQQLFTQDMVNGTAEKYQNVTFKRSELLTQLENVTGKIKEEELPVYIRNPQWQWQHGQGPYIILNNATPSERELGQKETAIDSEAPHALQGQARKIIKTIAGSIYDTNRILTASWNNAREKIGLIEDLIKMPRIEPPRFKRNFLGIATESQIKFILKKIKELEISGSVKTIEALQKVIAVQQLTIGNLALQEKHLEKIEKDMLDEMQNMVSTQEIRDLATIKQTLMNKLHCHKTEILTSIYHINEKTEHWLKIIQDAANGRVSPLLIGPEELENVITPFQTSAHLDVNSYASMKAELLIIPEGKIRVIMLKVPHRRIMDEYRLFKLDVVQVPTSKSSHIRSKVDLPMDSSYVMKKEGEKCVIASPEDLNACTRKGTTWNCNLDAMQIAEDDIQTCLHLLTENVVNHPLQECKTTYFNETQEPKVRKVHSGMFIYEAPVDTTALVTCAEGPSTLAEKVTKSQELARLGLLSLPYRCQLKVGKQVIFPIYQEESLSKTSKMELDDAIFFHVSELSLLTSPLWKMLNTRLTGEKTELENIKQALLEDGASSDNTTRLIIQSKAQLEKVKDYIGLAKEAEADIPYWWTEEQPSIWNFTNIALILIVLVIVGLGAYKLRNHGARLSTQGRSRKYDLVMQSLDPNEK